MSTDGDQGPSNTKKRACCTFSITGNARLIESKVRL